MITALIITMITVRLFIIIITVAIQHLWVDLDSLPKEKSAPPKRPTRTRRAGKLSTETRNNQLVSF